MNAISRDDHNEAVLPGIYRGILVLFVVLSFAMPKYYSISLGGDSVNPFNIVLMLLDVICVWILVTQSHARNAVFKGVIRTAYVFVILMTFMAWQVLCDLKAESPTDAVTNSIRYALSLVSAYLIGSILLLDARNRWSFIKAFVVCSVLASVIGIMEKTVSRSLISVLDIAQYAAHQDGVAYITGGIYRDGTFRALSLFAHPIDFGQFMAAILPLGAVLLLRARGHLRLFALLLIVLGPVAIYATESRSPIIVAIVAFTFLVPVWKKGITLNRAVYAGVTIVLLMVAYLVLWGSLSALASGRTTSENISTQAREMMVRNGMGMADASPIFGYGAGQSRQVAGLYGANEQLTIDNQYLSMLLDFGYVGAGLFVMFLVAIVISGLKAAATRQGVERQICLGLAAMVVGICTGQIALSIQENLFFVHLAGGFFFAILCSKGRPTTSVWNNTAQSLSGSG